VPVSLAPDNLSIPLRSALDVVCELFERRPIDWAVSGSVACALHGLPGTPHDLDLVLDGRSAELAATLLAAELEEPIEERRRGAIRGRLGTARIGGVTVELLADLQHELSDGSWTPPLDVAGVRVWGELDGYPCPVVSLPGLAQVTRLPGGAAL
jgi:hypothetical protein